MEFFKEKKQFLSVSEGRRGIETFVSPEISRLEDGYKRQITAFIEQVKDELKKK